jgi:hypothetical protein
MAPGSHAAEVYWSVPSAAIRGILVRIRTALSDLVAELIMLMPEDQEVPNKLAADQKVQFVVTGDRTTIYYNSQHATDGGTNVTVDGGPASGPVTVGNADAAALRAEAQVKAIEAVAALKTR